MIFESFSSVETENFARKMASQAKPGSIYCLNGDLGVGKTVFAKGFASGLYIQNDVTSPTFTLINEYTCGDLPFYHFDVYRIQHTSQMQDVGYEDYFYGEGVCLVEWANLIEELLPQDVVTITIEKNLNLSDDYRKITVKGRYNENLSD